MGMLQLFGTVGLIIAALGVALVIPMGGGAMTTTSTVFATSTATSSATELTTSIVSSTSTISSSTTSTSSSTLSTSTTSWASTTGTPESTQSESVQGLELILSISTNQIYTGDAVQVNVSEFNSLDAANNVSKGSDSQIQAALSSCPNTNALPFGIAVYKGDYTAQNVSQGTQLQIFPVVPCPQYIRLVTGYAFEANSDLAAILPGSGITPMTGSVEVNGTSMYYGQSQPLPPGQYTVVAADEWGALAFLYFQVNGLP